ncbi:MFS transporter [Cereibacter sphaeroides]|uniref:MFS transporter n=1 Tax=Cereibacter sphaeroides TaxID=1063 RepID=UPI001F430B8A|nr:MFS transporter [Cereibacter sphaeroides]MCE6950695.1 MFS transporter [Cereibacter sphaeroides]MCE6959078.1 MFS transporter [Cereibacter sphaeroides]MCE6968319.1 MFS transporter [Cereibacter sphaeroides]MCE6974261.1 MFS transporter [Cereibacter sphaeroides]
MANTYVEDASVRSRPMTREERKVILASSAGTIFEWYDFYLYGSLAAIIGAQFFTAFPEATRNVFALLAFAAGFIVRPFGALVFGAMGDLIGRKYTFLATILIMGLSTFFVGLLPSYQSWGVAAPIILIVLRMAQGLALGGEYGGAAVYVAEHAPQNRRGYYTAFIQTTATLGLLLSLIVILLVQGYVNGNYPEQPVLDAAGMATMNADGTPAMMKAFNAWGWRIPFLGSIFLLLISLYIRLQMNESPAFKKMKEEGAQSKAPLREAFGQWRNARIALIALFGLTAGQAVVWYSGQFYALFFIQNVIKLDTFTANVLVAWSLILGTGGFLIFGALSDRIGRKPIILAGCLIAAITYFPVFQYLTKTANPALYAAHQTPVTVTADPESCSFQFNPTGTAKFTSSCDIAKALLAKSSVNYSSADAPAGATAEVKIGDTVIPSYDAATLTGDELKAAKAAFEKSVTDALLAVGYPLVADKNPTAAKADHFLDIFTPQKLTIVAVLTYLIILVTMVYGPIAAMLVELYPTRIRYSGLSLPYHIGNGWFGGLLPATAFAISAQSGNIYAGLWYAIVVALMTVIVGALLVPGKTHKKSIFADDSANRM